MLRRTPALAAALATALATAAPTTPAPAAAISSDEAFGSMTSFLLRNNGPTRIKDVYAQITPAFKVAVPPADHSTDPSTLPFTRGPMVVTDGGGFDRAGLIPHVSGEAPGLSNQLLWLEFPDGLQPGGFLQFQLGSDPSYTGALDLKLLSDPKTLTPLTGDNLTLKTLADTPPEPTPVQPVMPIDEPSELAHTTSVGTGAAVAVEIPALATSASGDPAATAPLDPSAAEMQVVPEPLTLALWSTGVLTLGLARARAYRRNLRTPGLAA